MLIDKIRKLLFAYKHPTYLYRYFMLRKASFEDVIKFHVNDTLKILSEKFRDFNPKEASLTYVEKMLKKYSFGGYPMVLYVACKLLQPEVVVETGTGSGLASAFILKALSENGKGVLYSIDLPRSVYQTEAGEKIDETYWVPEGRESGWAVPDDLRRYAGWKSFIGKSSELLPKIARECRSIDIFFHDSEHTYQNMYFEYRTVYPYLKIGGLLLPHDINLNNAFIDFAAKINARPIILKKGLGAIIKS
ncbi:MAG: class I SAM-dependent methyltransferase [Candidatus Bathyarchaeia archaeon]